MGERGRRRNQQDLLDLSWRRIKTRCACHETSPPPESQLNRSTVPKDSESPELLHLSNWPTVLYHPFPSSPFSLLSISLCLPLWPLILLAGFLSRELKSDVLSPDPIRHASRLMSSQPALKRISYSRKTSWPKRRLDNCPYFQRDWSVPWQKEYLALSFSFGWEGGVSRNNCISNTSRSKENNGVRPNISRNISLFFQPAADEVNYSRTEFLFMRTGLNRSERNIDVVANIPEINDQRDRLCTRKHWDFSSLYSKKANGYSLIVL